MPDGGAVTTVPPFAYFEAFKSQAATSLSLVYPQNVLQGCCNGLPIKGLAQQRVRSGQFPRERQHIRRQTREQIRTCRARRGELHELAQRGDVAHVRRHGFAQ